MKKILGMVLLCIMVFALMPTQVVFAENVLDETEDFGTEEVTAGKYAEVEEFRNYETVSALYEIREDGEEIPVDADIDIDYSVKRGKNYTVNVKASTDKTSSGSKSQDNVTLTGAINWTDVTGTNNVLRSVSGSCSGSVEYNDYSYGTGPYFINTTWHKETNFGSSFYDSRDAGRTANSFVLEISAKPSGKSKFVLRVYTKLTD